MLEINLFHVSNDIESVPRTLPSRCVPYPSSLCAGRAEPFGADVSLGDSSGDG